MRGHGGSLIAAEQDPVDLQRVLRGPVLQGYVEISRRFRREGHDRAADVLEDHLHARRRIRLPLRTRARTADGELTRCGARSSVTDEARLTGPMERSRRNE